MNPLVDDQVNGSFRVNHGELRYIAVGITTSWLILREFQG